RDLARLGRPVVVVVTNPWHRRSADELAARYGAGVFVGGDGPLPAGLAAYPGGMQPEDVVVHAPSRRAIVTGDTIVDNRLCPEDWLAKGRAHQVECLERVVALDADLVVPAHGTPFPVAELAALLHSPPSAP